MKKLLIASNSKGKIKEFKQALKHLNFQIITPKEIDLPQNFKVKETGDTFKKNALIKAKAFGNKTSLLTLADDSGLIVKALNGRPGVYSRRYGTTTKQRNKRLLEELKLKKNRQAYYEAVIAIYDPQTNTLKTCSGKTYGHILDKPVGSGGFGYDPIFYSSSLKKSFAQASTKAKNKVSHRGKALIKAIKILKQFQK